MNRVAPIVRSTPFRSAAAYASAFVAGFVLLFAFIYWQTAISETARIDRFILKEVRLIAAAPPEQILWVMQTHVATDLHRVAFAALFDRQGRPIAGNLAQIPADLPTDGRVHRMSMVINHDGISHGDDVIAVAQRLPDGRSLVMGRNIEELSNLRRLVTRALALGVIPAGLLALGVGAFAGHRTWRRVRSWQRALDRVRDGHFAERLPTRGSGDDLDCLAEGVNQMLAELERLLDELHNVGNNIAHDLRTPLARVRAQLERARRGPHSPEILERTIDKTIAGIDQSISITTALLRIADIERNRRRDAFAPVDLTEIAKEVADFYEPAAEQRQIALEVELPPGASLFGDRDLLFEAIANLVDNAIKFTPEGGRVRLWVGETSGGLQLRVSDTGPGIPAAARDDVFKRFYRFDPSRHASGFGLGLSLVAAIAKLHGFSLALQDNHPGCVVVMTCPPAERHRSVDLARCEVAAVTH